METYERDFKVQKESIAIIGLSCRFPKAKNPAEFWQDAISEVPKSRWVPTNADIRWGGFIDELEQFDPIFFGISPREAQSIAPTF
ncbi:MAG TPA: hypothetical protein ENG03_09970 [Thioploca sp.]|nr:MAG: hypothetical protein B6247_26875 [Beggiatoa sp. 4572_84]RKZ56862.1 MAG: hypothetical protein DRR08_20545 [Gammaproteobacteria bacterium]HDN27402.1 hypothetical protein [Thioploca sp.]